ncbi:MAG: hypothetical protein XFASWVDF_001205 [Candidatus Fervidibacter sp.]
MLLVRCAAKVNLCLSIVRRREDGYHDLRSLMVAVSLWDELHIVPSDRFGLEDEAGQPLPQSNTVWRAAHLLAQEVGISPNFTVRLLKRIPSEAGLGGGSSDAAGMLKALQKLWGLRWSWRRLVPLAARIGADVPFFLVPTGAAIAEGIGERLTPLWLPTLWMVLVMPEATMPTKDAFDLWDAHPTQVDADPMALAEALSRGDWAQIRHHTQNAFEPLIATRIPSVTDLKARLMAAGAMAAVMSGSGTSVVGLFADAMAARRALKMVRPFAAWGVVAHSVRRSIVLRWGRKG